MVDYNSFKNTFEGLSGGNVQSVIRKNTQLKSQILQEKHWTNRFNEIEQSPKKMERYREKMREFLLRVLLGSYPEFFAPTNYDSPFNHPERVFEFEDLIKDAMLKPCTTLEECCAKYLWHILCLDTNSLRLMGVPSELFTPSEQIDLFSYVSKNEARIKFTLYDFFKNDTVTINEEETNYNKIFEKSLTLACNNHLKKELMRDEELNSDNFLTSLSNRGAASAQAIAVDVFSTLTQCIQAAIFHLILQSSSVEKSLSQKNTQRIMGERDSYKKELHNAGKEIQKKNREIVKKDAEIKRLSDKLKSKKTTFVDVEKVVKEKTEGIAEENRSLYRQNKKLQTYYSALRSKYERLKSEMGNSVIDIEEDEREEMKEVDVNARYLFLLYDNIGCRQNIKEAFPNAEFTSKVVPLSSHIYDMVVSLTECIDHSNYLAMKKQCKIHGVPFAHSPYSNIDMIKTVIWNVING